MQGFLLSIRVVTPILLMLGVGMLVRRLGWVDEKSLNVMDRLGFKLLLPTQLFTACTVRNGIFRFTGSRCWLLLSSF